MYVLQHAIFMVARPIIFVVYSILTCCCDKGIEFSENETFDDRIISYNYIESELPNYGNFENYPSNPLAELAYNRDIARVSMNARNRSEEHLAKKEIGASAVMRASHKISNAMQHRLSLTQQSNICCICNFTFDGG